MSEFQVFSLNFFNYKKPFYGSYHEMRYGIRKEVTEQEETGEKTTELLAFTWKGPLASMNVAEEDKTYKRFPFSEEGREDLLDWLAEEYEAKYRETI